jgi:hypothetical protein
MAAKYAPETSRAEFDTLKPALRADLKKWWKQNQAGSTPPPTNPATAAVWGKVPTVDSKTVARASPVVRKYLGVGINPKLIRKGGYATFDEALDDILPKLRASCSETAVAVEAAL